MITGEHRHAVAIIGGATAGAEIASRLATAGADVTVFEMNPRPYGKIEDGLPHWHSSLRKKEYTNIRTKLTHERIELVPNTKIGVDVPFAELCRDWGFSAVVLACGAWRDRPLAVDGAADYADKGLIYQNPFIIGFNHKGYDKEYKGKIYESLDDALVVGGGLASIDVAKVLALETAAAKLKELKGVDSDLEEMEKKGIPKTLAEHDLKWEDLGLKGCSLFYRRRPEDMPLMTAPRGATPERMAKVEKSRRKILDKAQEKFCFTFEGLSVPKELIIEDGKAVGLKFERVERGEGRKLIPTGEFYERRGSCIISSIGSIPEPMPGVKMNGELFPFTDWDLGRMEGFPNVFSAGNVVTGKGNIIASRRHAEQVAQELAAKFLGLEDGHDGEEAIAEAAIKDAAETAEKLAREIEKLEKVSPEALTKIHERVKARQAEVGMTGSLDGWLDKVTPENFS